MKNYRIGFIGASGHWNYVTHGMTQLPQTELAAVAPSFANEDMSALTALKIRDRQAKYYPDYLEMLEQEALDIVSITPRYDLIAPLAMEAARRGIHVIAEKPLALSIDSLVALKQTVNRAGIRLTTMLGIRYQSAFYNARLVVAAGSIGEPNLIWAQKSYKWGQNRPVWYQERSTYGSTINWVGIHALDWARWLSGVEFTEVFGYHSTQVHRDFQGCQDICGLVTRLANGGIAVFNFDYLRPETAQTHGDDRIRIAGSKGVLEVIGREDRLSLINEKGEFPKCPLQNPPDFLADFINELEGNAPALISQDDAFRITEIAIQATRAADSGQIIQL